MIRSDLCDNSDVCILLTQCIYIITTITREEEDDAPKTADKRNKAVIFENFEPFTECTININNTQIDHANDIDVVVPMYKLIKCRDNYSKIPRSL